MDSAHTAYATALGLLSPALMAATTDAAADAVRSLQVRCADFLGPLASVTPTFCVWTLLSFPSDSLFLRLPPLSLSPSSIGTCVQPTS